MATRAEQTKADQQRANSASKRAARPGPHPNKNEMLRAATAKSDKGRALHAPTKRRADAKACKPGAGPVPAFWKTGINGGEEQTVNGVAVGRGADGPASIRNASRKSTRGAWPGGEKDAQLPRVVRRATHSPEARAMRGR